MTYFAQLATATLMLLSLSAPGALSADTEKMKLRPRPNPSKLRGAVYLESDAHAHEYEYEASSTSAVKILQDDMDALAEAFCGAAVAISEAFWTNGGKHHSKDDAYPRAACDAAYEQATAALNGAYNYPDPVLFKPTLSSAPLPSDLPWRVHFLTLSALNVSSSLAALKSNSHQEMTVQVSGSTDLLWPITAEITLDSLAARGLETATLRA